MKKRTLHNRSELLTTRRKLRNAMTPAEARLWTYLQKGQLAGRKFRRQHSVGRYVLDFYCSAEKLCVELDGEAHAGPIAAEYDAQRSAFLERLGIRVVRFENQVVWDMPEAMLERIKDNFKEKLKGA
jgi:very-short-patch-repair endonuclease